MNLKKIAWDGISFDIPSSFEVSGIDKKFLQLDNGEYPCLEIRWYEAGKSYKEKTYFRQLAKKVESASGIKIESTVMPGSWKAPLKEYDATAFYWQSDLSAGRGVMFYCKQAAQVMLVQFIGKCDDCIDNAAIKFFESLRFQNRDEEAVWRIYDMQATMPAEFALDSFEFKPGRFIINLADSNETVSLYRFGPADVILKNTSLSEFSQELFKEDISKLGLSRAELEYETGATCMFGQKNKPSVASLALSKLNGKKRPYAQIEVRYTQESNRILAVKSCSRIEQPEDRVKLIFNHYEIIQ
ncbi:hypothetical protein [Maridesulfovibrio sp.]|uniref:hypothetical protein n=1 Tax=Maridesulfovibrio sp. TaxID=2795000 RepID=UPI002A18E593|nr:hypothetical protein [Maridesulfovibrio sp.]